MRSLITITFVVTAVHFFFIYWTVRDSEDQSPTVMKERLVVQTITIAPNPKETLTAPPKKSAELKIVKAQKPPKVEISKEQNKAVEVKKDVVEKKLTQKEMLIEKAQQNAAKLHQFRNQIKSDQKINQNLEELRTIGTLSIDRGENSNQNDENYYSLLSNRLQQLLKLPETGDVKIKLTLNRNGTCINLEILSTQSEVNKKYVESVVKSAKFPPFGNYLKNEEKHPFTILLTH